MLSGLDMKRFLESQIFLNWFNPHNSEFILFLNENVFGH